MSLVGDLSPLCPFKGGDAGDVLFRSLLRILTGFLNFGGELLAMISSAQALDTADTHNLRFGRGSSNPELVPAVPGR